MNDWLEGARKGLIIAHKVNFDAAVLIMAGGPHDPSAAWLENLSVGWQNYLDEYTRVVNKNYDAWKRQAYPAQSLAQDFQRLAQRVQSVAGVLKSVRDDADKESPKTFVRSINCPRWGAWTCGKPAYLGDA